MMIAERMEESLVLLSHKLCLPLYQMASFKKNARMESNKVSLSEDEKELLLQLQEVDFAVYKHFSEKFQKEVESFGLARMQESVQELRNINNNVRYKLITYYWMSL